MDGLLRDVRQAVRNLLRTPGFSLVMVVTLALGIGANSAIFSVLNAVLLRPLGYPRPAELIYVSSQFPQLGFDQFWVSPPEFFEFQERARAFSSVGAFATGQGNLTAPDRPRRVNAVLASADLFRTLGVGALSGRTFDEAETRPSGPDVAIVTYDLWQGAFGGDPRLLGSLVEIDGVRRTIVGIMPRGFDVADQRADVFLPLVLDPAQRAKSRGNHYLYLIGRLAPGQTEATARAELETLLAGWQQSVVGSSAVNPDGRPRVHSPGSTGHRLRFDALQAQVVGGARTAVWVLQAAVLLVLLIACANLANLLLARAETRHKEFAVRTALGASRWQLLRQFMVEGTLLSVAGAALGLVFAVFGVRAILAAYPDSLPRSADVAVDGGVLVFTLGLAVATGVVFGLAPLLHLSADATAQSLKESGQRTTAGAGRHRFRRALVVSEVALAVTLVVGAGLLLRTVANLTRVDGGFSRGNLSTFLIELPAAKYKDGRQVASVYRRLIDRLKSQAGVQAVGAMSGLPPLRQVNANDTTIEGYKAPPEGPLENVDYYQVVTDGYVEAMGIPVVEGRAFQPGDANGAPVVMINETMARTFWRGQSPVGRRVRPCCNPDTPWLTVVGVLKDVKQGGVDRKTGTELYFDFEQLARVPGAAPNSLNLVLRTTLPLASLAGPIRQAVAEIDPTLPVVKLRSMEDVFADGIGRPRLLSQLLGLFAGLAVLLAAIGSYGVLAYMVSERRREIGIRMALGAERGAVLRLVIGQGVRLAGAGIVLGVALALASNRLMASLLFGVAPGDPLTLVAVVGLVSVVAALACYLPARTATLVDPMVVLREE